MDRPTWVTDSGSRTNVMHSKAGVHSGLRTVLAGPNLPAEMAEYLRYCKMVAVPKKDGRFRPVGLGNSLTKAAGKILFEASRPALKEAMLPCQLSLCEGGS